MRLRATAFFQVNVTAHSVLHTVYHGTGVGFSVAPHSTCRMPCANLYWMSVVLFVLVLYVPHYFTFPTPHSLVVYPLCSSLFPTVMLAFDVRHGFHCHILLEEHTITEYKRDSQHLVCVAPCRRRIANLTSSRFALIGASA